MNLVDELRRIYGEAQRDPSMHHGSRTLIVDFVDFHLSKRDGAPVPEQVAIDIIDGLVKLSNHLADELLDRTMRESPRLVVLPCPECGYQVVR